MAFFIHLILALYAIAILAITVFCLMQLHLLYNYKRSHGHKQRVSEPKWERIGFKPFVTIQLPVYNEMYVVERLIDSIMQLDYPKDRFEVHILDDSTDETVEIIKRKVFEYTDRGYQVRQIRRKDRKGYKAGALKDAMPLAKGEFIAIFDADFLPERDFLSQTLAWFQDERTGVVQTRWEHINENYSLITRLQALQLNVHFRVEQPGRSRGNYLLQFNGTAGIWRRAAIDDAGGWEADTLTEDLDLSIRAQLKGWKIVYLEDVGAPAELPSEMNGLKSQQFRWMKGGAETARKMLPAVWRSNLRLGQKVHASMQLLGSSVFVFVFIMGVLSVPILFVLGNLGALGMGSQIMSWTMVGFFAFLAVQYVANVQAPAQQGGYLKKLIRFLFLFPLFLSLSMGLSLHNTVAVIQGWLGRQSAFIRTPKFDIRHWTDSFRHHRYLHSRITWTTLLEGALAVYFICAVFFGYRYDNLSFLFLHLLLALGYGSIFYFTLRHLKYK